MVCRGEQQPQQGSNFVLGEWQLHVLANMPFFCLLLPMLLELEASRLAAGSRPDSQELLQVSSPPVLIPDSLNTTTLLLLLLCCCCC